MPPVSSGAKDSSIRHPSASDSLQNNLSRDVELSLNRNVRHSAWRDGVSSIARSILLKAKDSIDTLRAATEGDGSRSKVDLLDTQPQRNPSSAGGSLRSIRPRNRDDSADSRHASLSLRRVLTGGSRRSKQSPLLVNLMSKRSTSKLHGPEEMLDDAASSKTDISSTRTILHTLTKRGSPFSKHSSPRSSPNKDQDTKSSSVHSSPVRASLPIPIPNSSPPPVIDLEIESGDMSPKRLFGLDSPPPTATREPLVIPVLDTASRDQLIFNSRRSKRQAVKSEMLCPPVPRRTSNDHWRLRQAARNRSARLPGIPGAALPLDELSAGLTGQPKAADITSPTPGLDGASERAEVQLEAHLQSPSAGHIDPLTGRWVSNDPVATLETDNGTSDSAKDAGLAALRQAAKEVTTRQVLLERAPDVLSPESLRAELEAGRKALERLERRMAGIEAGLRNHSSAGSTPTKSRETIELSLKTQPSPAEHDNIYQSPRTFSSPIQSRVTSSSFSFSSVKSPLEVQDLFYDSDNECWNPRQSASGDFDSASSSAQHHLLAMRDLATNGALPASPTMGSPEVFFRLRTERAARYYDIFHAASASREPSSSVSAARTDELAESAFRARTPEMLSWVSNDDDDNALALVDSGQGDVPAKAATSIQDEDDELTPKRQMVLRKDLANSLGWQGGPGLRGSPVSPAGLCILSPGKGSVRRKRSGLSDGKSSDDGVDEDSSVVHRGPIACPSP